MTRAIGAWLGLLMTLLCATYGTTARADAGYPSRPVKIILAGAPGSATDTAIRALAEQLTSHFKVPFVVESRPGAAGNIGTAVATRAAADGYTLFVGVIATLAMNPHLYDNLGYDPDKDVQPIALTGFIPMAISVDPASPFRTLGDFIRAAKEKPGTLNVAVPTTTARIVFELLQQQTATKLFAVPHNSTPSAMNDLIGGQVVATIDTTTATRSLAEAAKIRPIAVTSKTSTDLLPGVRSVEEQGVADFQVTAWNALCAQKGVSPAIVETLRAATARILAEPGFRQKMMSAGFEVPASDVAARPPDDFIRAERDRWGALIRSAGIKAN